MVTNDSNEQYVIIGGGIASLSAARAIRSRDKTGAITMVCGENHPPYSRPSLPGVMADGLSFESLLLEGDLWYAENRVALLLGKRVLSIDAGARSLALDDGAVLPYTKLLLATGSQPFNPVKSAPGAIPVLSLRSYEDAAALGADCAGKRVVVVGGGILGLEAACALHARGAHVTVVELGPRLLSIQADAAVSAMIESKLYEMGMTVITGKSVDSATPAGALLSDGAAMAADVVLASLGVRSDVSLALAIGLDLSRGIVVDAHMRTSHPDIWAAGDCAEFSGRVLAIAGAASAMGLAAGASMAGDDTAPYAPFLPSTFFELPGLSMFSAGNVDEKTAESAVYTNTATGVYRRLFYEQSHLSGVLFVGGAEPARILPALRGAQTPAESLALLGA